MVRPVPAGWADTDTDRCVRPGTLAKGPFVLLY